MFVPNDLILFESFCFVLSGNFGFARYFGFARFARH